MQFKARLIASILFFNIVLFVVIYRNRLAESGSVRRLEGVLIEKSKRTAKTEFDNSVEAVSPTKILSKNILITKFDDSTTPVSPKTRSKENSSTQLVKQPQSINNSSTETAILVITCNRAEALKNLLDHLVKYRPSPDIPIIVSQDCDEPKIPEVIDLNFKQDVEYIKHEKNGSEPMPGKNYIQYSYISNHYRNALKYVFDERKFETVVIVEDDLDVAPDFFSYFLALRKYLLKDPTLYCVSAWNHNGSPELIDPTATTLLYRTDFFTGLGWMLTKSLWDEIGPKWPNAFWDDWIILPEQRKNRQCIRPEIGRTSMTKFGKSGASSGEYFKEYIERVVLNSIVVDFKKLDLYYLDPVEYRIMFIRQVSDSDPLSNISNLTCEDTSLGTFRMVYQNFEQMVTDNKLGLMKDERSGIRRNSYEGIVPFVYNNCRIFLVPRTFHARPPLRLIGG